MSPFDWRWLWLRLNDCLNDFLPQLCIFSLVFREKIINTDIRHKLLE